MELNKSDLIEELFIRKAYCNAAVIKYNKKLLKKFIIALGISILYASVRMFLNPSEKISFFTTLIAIFSFSIVIILVNHKMLINKIKTDINDLESQITVLKKQT